jgi:hypothetical protein
VAELLSSRDGVTRHIISTIWALNGYMSERDWRAFFYALSLCVLVLICATFLDYGLTWDEDWQANNGIAILKWYGSFFRDHTAIRTIHTDLYLYGGFYDCVASGIAYTAWKVFHAGFYETRHLVNAFFGLGAIVGAYKLGALLSGPMGGFFSAFFLTLTPMFYGHLFNNPKDIPFATLFIFSIYYLVLSYDSVPRIPTSRLVKLAIAIGLTLAIRIGGILLFGYSLVFWAGALAVYYVFNRLQTRPSLVTLTSHMGYTFGLLIVLAWGVMLVWWPWAQISPLAHPLQAVHETAHFQWDGHVFFNGSFVHAAKLPWNYLPTWLAISLPEFYFIALIMGGFLACRFLISFQRTLTEFARLMKIGLLLAVVCFPLLILIFMHPTVYNGMRHFLFLLPVLAVLTGISLAGLLRSHVSLLIKGTAGMLIVLSAGTTTFDMVQLHPYESVYFNRMVAGGLEGAAPRFETDYWGNSYKEGAEWVIQNYRSPLQRKIRIATCGHQFSTAYSFQKTEDLRNRFETVRREESPDIVLATISPERTGECHKTIQGYILYTVERRGIPLLYVIATH